MKKPILVITILLCIFILTSGCVDIILGERILTSFEDGGDGVTVPYESHQRSLTFRPDKDWLITKISLHAGLEEADADPGIIYVEIKESDGGPTGTPLAYSTYNGNTLDVDKKWIDFDLSEDLSLTVGNEYAIVFYVPDATYSHDQVEFTIAMSDVFADSSYYTSLNNGTSWTEYPRDAYFRVYGTTS